MSPDMVRMFVAVAAVRPQNCEVDEDSASLPRRCACGPPPARMHGV